MLEKLAHPLVLITEASPAEAAVDRVASLLGGRESRLSLLDVGEAVSDEMRAMVPGEILEQVMAASAGRQAERLAGIARRARDQGIEPTTKQLSGSAYRLAIREVVAGHHDLLIKVVDTVRSDWRAPRSSADNHLLRQCPCPVWLESPDHADCRTIVAAVDPDPDAPEKQALSLRVLEAGIELAQKYGATLHVLHAWHAFGEFLLFRPRPPTSDPETDHLIGAAFNRHRQLLDELCERVPPGLSLEKHLVHQSPAPAIVDLVTSENADLLILGTVGRSGIPGLLIGNTAESVLGEVTCSVLALKPAGFVSPVTADD